MQYAMLDIDTPRVAGLSQELMLLKAVELKSVIRDLRLQFGNRIRPATRKADMCDNIEALLATQANRQAIVDVINDYMPAGRHFYIDEHNSIVMSARRGPFASTRTAIPQAHSSVVAPAAAAPAAAAAAVTTSMITNPRFKSTPFYTPVQRLAGPVICPIVSQTCSVRTLAFTLNDARLDHEVRVYCAASMSSSPAAIEFPQVSELHINGSNGHIPASQLRGIKNTPGSVHAANITRWCNRPGSNQVQLIYAKTEKQYVATVELVKVHPVEELIQQMIEHRSVTKDDILTSFREQQANADIQLQFETLSLKCPLSCSRITLPCRSRNCRHAQCFDGVAYMRMNEQTPTWKCPVCNCPIPYEDLIVDGFFADLLANSSDSIQSVRINPSGELQHEFTVKEEEESDGDDAYNDEQGQTSSSAPVLSSLGGGPTEQSLPTTTTTTTPATTTTTPSIPANNSNNRSVVMVDLTLSDNE